MGTIVTALSVIRSRSVTVKNWCNVLSIEGITVYGHPEGRVTFRRGGPLLNVIRFVEIVLYKLN